MKEVGEIVKLEGYEAVVRIQRSSACGKCGACGLGYHSNEMLITVPNLLGGKPGDLVELSLDSSQLIKASAITYLIPLLALIIGVAVGYLISDRLGVERQLGGAVIGIVFATLAFLVIRAIDPLLKRSNHFTPRMIAILNIHREES